jgi:hypothetical protein
MSDQHMPYVRGQQVIVQGEGGPTGIPEHDIDPFVFQQCDNSFSSSQQTTFFTMGEDIQKIWMPLTNQDYHYAQQRRNEVAGSGPDLHRYPNMGNPI